MKLNASILIAAAASLTLAQPGSAGRIISDPTDVLRVTHCAWMFTAGLDTNTYSWEVAPKNADGRPYCSKDISDLDPGEYSVKAAFVDASLEKGDPNRIGLWSEVFTFTIASPVAAVVPFPSPVGLRVLDDQP